MAFDVRNSADAANADYVNVLGLRGYARARTALTADVSVGASSIDVSNAAFFRAGDTLILGDVGTTEPVTVDSVAGNTVTITGTTTNAYNTGERVVAPWHDFGHVRNPSREQDLTELEVKSARLGRLATIKKITTEQTLEFTFESISVFDKETIALHTGGATEDGVIGTGGIVAVEEFTGVQVEFLMVQENAESGGKVKVAYYPLALVKGDGEDSGDGENESALTFRTTILQDENYAVPSTLATGTPAAPYGFRYICEPTDEAAVLDALSV